jgi:hypothetical protein
MKAFATLFVLLVVLGMFTTMSAIAEEGSSHEGTVVSAGSGKLVMKDDQGKEHSHKVEAAVKITVNGKDGKLEDLKAGMKIRVMMDKDNHVASISTVDSEKQ